MLEFLEQNAGGVVILLLLAFAAEVFISFFPRRKHGRRETDNTILNALSRDAQEMFILIEKGSDKVVFVSENCTEILGIQPSYLYADLYALSVLMDSAEQRRVTAAFEDMQKERKPLVCECRMKRFDTTAPLQVKLTARPTTEGGRVLLTVTDISQEEQVRQELREEIREVQSIDESKTQFLSKMSHEIRTPMNGMLGMISLARLSQQKNDSVEAEGYLEKAEGLTQFLLSIINDILDMSRIESGKLELEQAPFRLSELVEKLRTMFNTTITSKGIAFKTELQDFTVQDVIGDELRITQVITNFLSNASKFTPRGGHISLTLRQMELHEQKLSFMIRVKDDGAGMTPEFLHRIFIPFEQEDSGIARKYGGSGLGMAIADNLVRQMGGQILVNSELGKGSEFIVFLELPVAQPRSNGQSMAQRHNAVELRGMRMLMAEDNDVNAKIAVKLLEHRGLVIERVSNGQEALEAFSRHEPGYYKAVLMDIHMPVMDGWTATERIRALGRPDAAVIPIIALSADAFVEDKRHSTEIGMNGHVAKPIDFDELQRVLEDCIAEQGEK